MDILIESTSAFEKDVARLSERDKEMAIQKINECVALFPTQRAAVYRKLRCLSLPIGLNGYESSLYMLQISQQLRMILAVDEDPIFGQAIFTLFRIVNPDDFYQAHKGVAESLYQELLHQDREAVQVS